MSGPPSHAARRVLRELPLRVHAEHHSDREPQECLLGNWREARSHEARGHEGDERSGGAFEESAFLRLEILVLRELAEALPDREPERDQQERADDAEIE